MAFSNYSGGSLGEAPAGGSAGGALLGGDCVPQLKTRPFPAQPETQRSWGFRRAKAGPE